MNKVVVDDALREKLNGLQAQIELCEPSGQTIGRFVPEEVYLAMAYALALRRHDDAEIDRLRRQTDGRELHEIWRTLGQS